MTNPRYADIFDRETMLVSSVVLIGALMAILDETVVNVALDRLATEFKAPFTTIQWVVSAYALALAAVAPVTGWASDRFGTKRIYLGAVVVFMLGSALCALAWNAESLIAFRVVQGVGGGVVLPVVMTIVAKQAGPHRRSAVMGVLGVPLLAAPIFGLVLGGWLVDSVSWRAIFLVNLPIGAVAIILAQVVLKRDSPQPGHRLDWLGMALLSPGLCLFIFGFAQSPAHGFGATRSWLPIVTGLSLVTTFFVHTWRSPIPLIDVRTFVRTRAGAASVTLLLLTIALFGTLLLVPVYFQVVRGTSALEAGLLAAPQGIAAMLAMPVAGWLANRHGPFWLPACSIPLMVVGMVPFALVTDSTPFVVLCAFSSLIGVGLVIGFVPVKTAAMQVIPERELARTSTALNIVEQSGASIGAAVLSVLLAAAVASTLPGAAGIDALEHLSPAQRATHSDALAAAFASTFTWALVVLVVAFVPALALALGRPRGKLEKGVKASAAAPRAAA